MPPVLTKKKTMHFRSEQREDYVFPERIVLDVDAFEEFSAEMTNPRPPNAALRALFKR